MQFRLHRFLHGLATAAACLVCSNASAESPRLERLGRGLVAVHQGQGNVFLSWRMLSTDPPEIAFDVYRKAGDGAPKRLNERPIAGATWFQDSGVDLSLPTEYFVRLAIPIVVPPSDGEATVSSNRRPPPQGRAATGAIVGRQEQPAGAAFKLPANAPARPYLSVPLQTPPGYFPNDASVGDLDGDGEYEIVLHQVGRGRDNSQRGATSQPILEAYKLDGTLLWRINLGKNIREGAHYTQFMVYDLDGDGRAELACKTADGTLDGRGKPVGNPERDYRNADGFILDGPEFLTLFDGRTGAALATADYIPPRGGDGSSWGDNRGNRVDRFLACVAYLDGQRPSLVMCRGYYTRCVLAAWDWRDGQLASRWVFDSDSSEANRAYRG